MFFSDVFQLYCTLSSFHSSFVTPFYHFITLPNCSFLASPSVSRDLIPLFLSFFIPTPSSPYSSFTSFQMLFFWRLGASIVSHRRRKRVCLRRRENRLPFVVYFFLNDRSLFFEVFSLSTSSYHTCFSPLHLFSNVLSRRLFSFLSFPSIYRILAFFLLLTFYLFSLVAPVFFILHLFRNALLWCFQALSYSFFLHISSFSITFLLLLQFLIFSTLSNCSFLASSSVSCDLFPLFSFFTPTPSSRHSSFPSFQMFFSAVFKQPL